MIKKDLIDLEFILTRRRVALEEWLTHHGIQTKKDFNEKAAACAASIDCYISPSLKEKMLNVLETTKKTLTMTEIPVLEHVEDEGKKKAKKTSLNLEQSNIELQNQENNKNGNKK